MKNNQRNILCQYVPKPKSCISVRILIKYFASVAFLVVRGVQYAIVFAKAYYTFRVFFFVEALF